MLLLAIFYALYHNLPRADSGFDSQQDSKFSLRHFVRILLGVNAASCSVSRLVKFPEREADHSITSSTFYV
jgi:hypothetical protein